MNEDIMRIQTNSSRKIEYLIAFICFISNISQLPIFIGVTFVKTIVVLSWLLLFSYSFIMYFEKLYFKQKFVLYMLLLFDMSILLASIYENVNYLSSNIIYPLHLSIFVFYCSQFIGQVVEKSMIYRISNYYVCSALILAVYIYIDTFMGTDWINSMSYLYESKNSVSQIFLIAIVLIIMFNKQNKILKSIEACFLVILLLMLKSRTTLIGLAAGFLYLVFFLLKGKKKYTIIAVSFLVLFIIYFNNSLHELLINNILLNNRSSSNFSLNDISSGRIEQLAFFKTNFQNSIFLGTGGTYIESFPLAALMSYGAFISIPLFLIVISPLIIVYRYKKDLNLVYLRHLIIIISIIMLSNSLFEELSPLGPGVKNYILWLITGLFTGLVRKKTNR